MATLDKDGVQLYKLDGRTYRADELKLVKKEAHYYEIRRLKDNAVVETTTALLEGVQVVEK